MKKELNNLINTSNSYQNIKSVFDDITSFHHHTHILYDIRTLLGEKPINYVEIGSYCGGSAAILLKHPYETHLYCIDPLNLPITHYNGVKNQHDTLKDNLEKYKNTGNTNSTYTILPHYSHNLDLSLIPDIDILFIDGGHLYNEVMSDFLKYHNRLNKGGFIIFDDYLDWKYSPDVKRAVDDIVNDWSNIYEVIGSLQNHQKAFTNIPREYLNDFVLYKPKENEKIEEEVKDEVKEEVKVLYKPKEEVIIYKPKEEEQEENNNNKITYAVIVATYSRPNGKTLECLNKLSKTLKCQTYEDFEVIIVGDDYNKTEWEQIPPIFDGLNVHFKNNPESFREGYFKIRENKWTNGGMLARYQGVKMGLEMGIDYYIHIDDDDEWSENHIQLLNSNIKKLNPDFIYTRSKYEDILLPRENTREIKLNNLPPRRLNVVQSSTCLNLKTLGKELLQHFERRFQVIDDMKTNKIQEILLDPFDATKWDLISSKENVKTLYIPVITCYKKTDRNIPV